MKDKEFTLEEIEVSHTLGGIHLVCVLFHLVEWGKVLSWGVFLGRGKRKG
jgi:hypothetical protein